MSQGNLKLLVVTVALSVIFYGAFLQRFRLAVRNPLAATLGYTKHTNDTNAFSSEVLKNTESQEAKTVTADFQEPVKNASRKAEALTDNGGRRETPTTSPKVIIHNTSENSNTSDHNKLNGNSNRNRTLLKVNNEKEQLETKTINTIENTNKLISKHTKLDGNSNRRTVLKVNNEREHVETKAINTTENTNKLILFWTKGGQGIKMWYGQEGVYQKELRHCEYQNCEFTDDKTRVKEADMILIKDRGMETENIGWPTFRSPNQLYVHHLGERPGPWHDYLHSFENKINLTMNYRKSADISVPSQQLYEHERTQLAPYTLRTPLKSKPKMVVWAVSHCITHSKREDYVKELRKYISVDIYGKCGNLSCSRIPNYFTCYERWEKIYKFYLSFENALCDDYITEKYHNILRYEMIPIVFSGQRYNSKTPPHEAIDIRDFKTPKDLARFLKDVARNETAYTEYFQWKQQYTFRFITPRPICRVCEAANVYKNKPAYSKYHYWWFSRCQNDYIDGIRKEGGW